ncbi:MAG: hypothetical protein IPH93_14865 [Saprospiraceae bacterium]|nr:hypothetical protein [Saprospiraceae bacterium]MBK7810787.1 hypothetical protein [Saprospiraceae bacterium]MBK9630382.1 hypothetical protein [Saprospiraceae bacterium]
MANLKRLFFTLVFFACWMAAQAQINKPVAGNKLMELSANGLANIGSGLNSQNGGVMLRVFKSDMKAHRWSADLRIDADTSDFTLSRVALGWGVENHMTGSSRMSTYWGYDAAISATANFDAIGIRIGVFSGFDYYIADGLYLGSELAYRLGVDSFDPFTLAIGPAALSASLKMGYRF